ncbi:MAG: glycosyltransferase family 92 protein [Gammaproteobacteria bacterium]|nr:glycosyltransferase family 92 protein [Gammaproteobacteria bacterium]
MSHNRCQVAIHTVFLPRENLFFIKEWLAYHTYIGIDHFYLYDNTGSIGRGGSTPARNKYGIDFYTLTAALSDAEVGAILNEILAEFGDHCTLIEWQPRDEKGQVVYGCEESIIHCMYNYSRDVKWLCAIDMDEFLYSPCNEPLDSLLDWLEDKGHSQCVLLQKKFEDRFLHLDKLVTNIENCIEGIDTAIWGPKNIILTDAFYPDGIQSIHNIPVRFGSSHWIDTNRLRFNHYNVNGWQLNWMKQFYNCDSLFKLDVIDKGMRRYRDRLHSLCETFGRPEWRSAIMELDSL